MPGIGLGISKVIKWSGLNLCEEYKRVYDAVSVRPSSQIALAQNAFVKSLVDGGVWAKLSCIIPYLAGMPQAADALFWWNNPLRKGTLSATAPTYTSKSGFTGNGSSSYIDTTFNPSTDGGTLYTQNDCSAGFLFMNGRSTGNTGGSGITATNNGICVYPRYNATQGTIRVNGNYYLNPNTGTIAKLFTLVRKSSSLINLFEDRTILGADVTNASAALLNLTIHNLHVNGDATSFQTDTIGLFYAGAQLTQDDVNVMCDALDTLMFAISTETILSYSADGAVIDTAEWGINNSDVAIATFEQNNELIMNSLVGNTTANQYYLNTIYSKDVAHFGVWKFSALSILNVGLTGYSQFGLRNSITSDAWMIGFSNDVAGNITFQIKDGISAAAYSVANALEYFGIIKIVVTVTHKISVYKWVNDAWVQIGISKNYSLGDLYLYMATRGKDSMKTSIRDISVTKFNYNTLNP